MTDPHINVEEIEILEIEDSNMAGEQWIWRYFLRRDVDRSFTLRSYQLVDGEDGLEILPQSGLRGGADIYQALESMLSEVSYSLDQFDLNTISVRIRKLDEKVASQFSRGQRLLDRREREAENRNIRARQKLLAPFQIDIDNYVLNFSDNPLRYPGGAGYGTQRRWAKAFIEEYVITHGKLPEGPHRIEVLQNGRGYSGPIHDFRFDKSIE